MNKNILLILIILIFAGCSKNRPLECAQGNCGGSIFPLKALGDLNKAGFIKTGTKINDFSVASDADVIHVDRSFKWMNDLPLVEIKDTDSNLIEGIPFRGRENHTYGLYYELKQETKNYLIIYKVGDKTDMPSQEWTIGKYLDADKNKFAVPLVIYTVSLINIAPIEDKNHEPTTQSFEYKTKNITEANYYRIDPTNRQLFSTVEKKDVFPADFFRFDNNNNDIDDEWYYTATIVSAGIRRTGWIGLNLGLDESWNRVSRIKLIKQRESIVAINVNIDEKITNENFTDGRMVFKIPVKWQDYEIETVGSKAGITEVIREKPGESNDKDILWSEKKHVKVMFDKLENRPYRLESSGSRPPKFHELKLENDYFSFVIFYPSLDIYVKYSLNKAHAPLIGRNYCEYEKNLFGFFESRKNYIQDTQVTKEEFCKYNFLNRFYPLKDRDGNGKREIVFNLVEGSNKKYIQAAARAVKAWNEKMALALKESKEQPIELSFDPKEVSFGDIRYNGIYLFDKKGYYLWRPGLATSVADGKSGEIISTSSIVQIEKIRNKIISAGRDYLAYKTGVFQEASFSGNKKILESGIMDNQILQFYKLLNSRNSVGVPHRVDALSSVEGFLGILDGLKEQVDHIKGKRAYFDLPVNTSDSAIKINFLEAANGKGTPQSGANTFDNVDISASFRNIFSRIEGNCPQLVSYAKSMDKETLQNLKKKQERDFEYDVLKNCAENLILDEITATLVRYLGHNLGLTYNLAGSFDKDNYPVQEKGKEQIKSSTVMDVLVENSDGLMLNPGPYDVAALRFGYGNQIEIQKANRVEQIKSSTIMGLPGETPDHSMLNPGVHDMAQHLIDIDNNLLLEDQVTTGKEVLKLTQNQNNNGRILKPYRYCNIEDIGLWDPFCTVDSGSTVEEVVESTVRDYNARLLMERKNDSIKAGGPREFFTYWVNFVKTFLPLKYIYDEWRYHLREFTASDGYVDPYLVDYSSFDDYNRLLANMKADSGVHGDNYEKYYLATRKIYYFLKQILAAPIRHCVVVDNNNTPAMEYWEFENLQQTIFSLNGATIHDCDSPHAMEYYKANNYSLHDSVGYFYNNIRTSLTPVDLYDPLFGKVYSSLGMAMDRVSSTLFLTYRFENFGLEKIKQIGFTPNFMDEMEFRCDLEEYLYSRILRGVDKKDFESDFNNFYGEFNIPNSRKGLSSNCNILKRLGLKDEIPSRNDESSHNDNTFDGLNRFEREKYFYSFTMDAFFRGINIPNDPNASIKRFEGYRILRGISPKEVLDQEIPESLMKISKIGPFFIGVGPDQEKMHLLFKRRDQIESMLNKIDLSIVEYAKLNKMVKNIPLPKFEDLKSTTFEEFPNLSMDIHHYFQDVVINGGLPKDIENILKFSLAGYLSYASHVPGESEGQYPELEAFYEDIRSRFFQMIKNKLEGNQDLAHKQKMISIFIPAKVGDDYIENMSEEKISILLKDIAIYSKENFISSVLDNFIALPLNLTEEEFDQFSSLMNTLQIPAKQDLETYTLGDIYEGFPVAIQQIKDFTHTSTNNQLKEFLHVFFGDVLNYQTDSFFEINLIHSLFKTFSHWKREGKMPEVDVPFTLNLDRRIMNMRFMEFYEDGPFDPNDNMALYRNVRFVYQETIVGHLINLVEPQFPGFYSLSEDGRTLTYRSSEGQLLHNFMKNQLPLFSFDEIRAMTVAEVIARSQAIYTALEQYPGLPEIKSFLINNLLAREVGLAQQSFAILELIAVRKYINHDHTVLKDILIQRGINDPFQNIIIHPTLASQRIIDIYNPSLLGSDSFDPQEVVPLLPFYPKDEYSLDNFQQGSDVSIELKDLLTWPNEYEAQSDIITRLLFMID